MPTMLASADDFPTPVASRTWDVRAQEYLKDLMPSRAQVRDFLTGDTDQNLAFDATLGWKHASRAVVASTKEAGEAEPRPRLSKKLTRSAGVFLAKDGARRVINGVSACRVHTFGSAFSSGYQVRDGQTWQECLAASIDEPVKNYGVAGYSAYQSYLKMAQVEKQAGAGAAGSLSPPSLVQSFCTLYRLCAR